VFQHQNLAVRVRAGHLLQPLPPDETWDLVLCSFALNEGVQGEASADVPAWARRLINHLNPGGLLLILEPALDAAAARLEALRDAMAAEGHGCIIGPCLHHRPCPLRREGRVYCHEVRRWTLPDSMAYLNRHLFRDLQVLKYCFLASQTSRARRPFPIPPGSGWWLRSTRKTARS
jgi:ribosomal protein RSM22 (predicted rRNA methylase)